MNSTDGSSALSPRLLAFISALAAPLGASVGCAHTDTSPRAPTEPQSFGRATAPADDARPRSAESEPSVTTAAPRRKTPRGLDPYQVSAVIRAGYFAFGGCQALDSDAQRRDGAITVDWVVRPDGSVHQVTIVESSFDSPAVDDCVAGVARTFRFPEAEATTHVAWKVRFQAQGDLP